MRLHFKSLNYSRDYGYFSIESIKESETEEMLDDISDAFHASHGVTAMSGDNTFVDFGYDKCLHDESTIRTLWGVIKGAL